MMNAEFGMMDPGRLGLAARVSGSRRTITLAQGPTRSRRVATLVAAALVFSACDDSTTDPGPEPVAPNTLLTVEAIDAWAYVDLGTTASQVTPADPSASTEWDIAFLATAVMLNGGEAGPADVSGYCLCENASASDEEIMALTPESELTAFEAVDLAAVPANDEDWIADALVPSIDEWYHYDSSTHQVSAAPENVWLVRAADSDALAKLHVTGIAGATRQHAGTVTIEYALKPSAESSFEATQTLDLDASNGSVYFDLESGAISDESNWDIMIDGFAIRVNGGASGSGHAGAARFGGSFDSITDDTELPPDNVYSADAFGGVFEAQPWYRYNLEDNHQIWPTYDVYLVRVGSDVYKLQLINYYNDAGDPRHITFRYARVN